MPDAAASPLPLYVDLDGTLVTTDTLWESLIALAKQNPRIVLTLIPSLSRGKAAFKAALAERVTLTPSDLPYHPDVLSFLQEEKQRGRRLILATASHERIARLIASHLGIFDDVLASTAAKNLKGEEKRLAIQAHARGAYEYLGDHVADLPIWQHATKAHAVFGTSQTWHPTISEEQRGKSFLSVGGTMRDLIRAMRLHQWAKNILLFLPLLLSHTFTQEQKVQQALIAFGAFSLTASSIYLLNDIFDIQSDRHHPEKRERPFAKGAYSIPTGLLLSFLIFVGGFVLGTLVSSSFSLCLLGYVIATTIYTLWLKRLPIIDVILIGFFYTYRIFAGAIATQTPVTDWLFAFATFFFISLGIEKRYGELLRRAEQAETHAHGRGYETTDLSILLSFGVNSAFLSVLVLALYVRSADVTKLYRHPSWLWGVVILLLVWIMRLWLLAHRGIVRDDPLLFTLRDKKSALIFVLILCILVGASL